ncbi:MAG: DUF3987 domain-containing protein [Methylocystaceae bacterium]|nr:DUF3987 domain-containing protein [Methylocystaceae bacterium]
MSDIKAQLENGISTISSPVPLTKNQRPVGKLTADMLPPVLDAFSDDVAERVQCPKDYVAVAAITVLGTVLAGKTGIKPKGNDDWVVRPNMWGVIIGPPSVRKSPSMSAALAPLTDIEKKERLLQRERSQFKEFEKQLGGDRAAEIQAAAQELFNGGKREEAFKLLADHEATEEIPPATRFTVNDATIEKLGELLNEHPDGLLLFRDELTGFLKVLERDDKAQDRSFFLEAFDSKSSYTYDRIGRGTITIERPIISILGSIQPSKLTPTVSNAISGRGDDGLIQRFQLAVWPDKGDPSKWLDIRPNKEVQERYRSLVDQLHQFKAGLVDEKVYCFNTEAQQAFARYWDHLHQQAHDDELHPAVQSHLLKQPKLIAGLALIFHLCVSKDADERISLTATEMAIKWSSYLYSHVQKIYQLVQDTAIDKAERLLKNKSKLDFPFSLRDVRQKHWVGLKDTKEINEAIEVLLDHNYLFELNLESTGSVGRPTIKYRWNNAEPKSSTQNSAELQGSKSSISNSENLSEIEGSKCSKSESEVKAADKTDASSSVKLTVPGTGPES